MSITYQEYKKQRQEGFNSLPVFFAFSKEQLQEGMKKHWTKKGKCPSVENAGKYLYKFGGGGFYYKYDAEKIHAYVDAPDPLDELMKDPEFAYSAFYYEMGNHEYHINWQGNYDVFSCFANVEYCDSEAVSDYMKQVDWSGEVKEAFYKARRDFLKAADENDWY